jgi:general secretion pathway protein A
MYEHFFNFFGLREDPFHVSPDPRFYYPTPAQEAALAELLFGIETRQGFLVLTGEAGTGKTTLLNQLLDWLHRRNRSSAYVFHTLLDPTELLQFIVRDFGLPVSTAHKGDLVNSLHTWLLARNAAGDLPVLILDEAQALPQQTLDELRLLLNLETPRGKLLQIILAGQPELDEKLRLPALRQLRQRVMFHSRIPLLNQQETAAYISCRLAAAGGVDRSLFSPEALEAIFASSRGIPRVVNLLSEHGLISAYAEQRHVVSLEMIQRIAVDFDLLDRPLAVTDPGMLRNYRRPASFPVAEFSSRPLVASQPSVKQEPVPGLPRPAAAAPPEHLAHTPYAATSEFHGIPKYWRKHRSRLAAAVAERDIPASLQIARDNLAEPFVYFFRTVLVSFFDYARSISRSFFRDCRQFCRALTMPTPALELGSSPASSREKSANHRKVLAPVVHWLRQPLNSGPIPSNRRPARSVARKWPRSPRSRF